MRREKTLSSCFAEGEQEINLCASAAQSFYLNLCNKKGEACSPFVLISFVATRLSTKLRLITQLY